MTCWYEIPNVYDFHWIERNNISQQVSVCEIWLTFNLHHLYLTYDKKVFMWHLLPPHKFMHLLVVITNHKM